LAKSVNLYHECNSSSVVAGRGILFRRDNWRSVSGLTAPSRWTCSSALGIRRTKSASFICAILHEDDRESHLTCGGAASPCGACACPELRSPATFKPSVPDALPLVHPTSTRSKPGPIQVLVWPKPGAPPLRPWPCCLRSGVGPPLLRTLARGPASCYNE